MADSLSLGPSPAWRSAAPAVRGVLAALSVLVAGVALEAGLVATTDLRPGVVLDWLPFLAAGGALWVAYRESRAGRQGALAAAVTLLALSTLAHPSPAPWMAAVPLAALAAALGFRLAPATRIVAVAPALTGSLATLEGLPEGIGPTGPGLLLVGLVLFALWFLVPHASGWRRIPFVAQLGIALTLPVVLVAAVVASLATTGLSTSFDGTGSAGLDLAPLVAGTLALAYPILVLLLWRSPQAQAFLLPSLSLPKLGAASATTAATPTESNEQA